MDEWLRKTASSVPRWIATLSDGTEYYQDDGRPGTEGNAWLRMKDYCLQNSLFVTNLRIQFRSHAESKPEYANAEGYWFRNYALGLLGAKKTRNSYLVGVVQNGIIKVDQWRIPEIVLEESEDRAFDPTDISLIMRT